MFQHTRPRSILRLLAASLLAALLLTTLCPLAAMADGQEDPSAVVQVIYASPEGYFATIRVDVSPQNNVVLPDPSLVPQGYVPVNANPVTLIFDRAGTPIPSTIFFTYQQQAFVTPSPRPQPSWPIQGQVLVYGQYEQDNDLQNGKEPVEWYVLKVEGTCAMLMARYGLDVRRFNEEWLNISWKDCTLRSWLNSVFYNECFNETEKRSVLSSGIRSNYVNTAVSTQDYVFALDANEYHSYVPQHMLRCVPTPYALANAAATQDGYCYWQLRDTTCRKNDANRVEPDGSLREYGSNTNAAGVCVRPVIWLNIATAFGF